MCVDGVLVAHEGKTDIIDDEGTMTFTIPAGTHLVEFYMPNLYSLRIKDMELIGATKAETVRKKYRMLAFGDSITQGYDALFSSLSYANITADLLNATLVDQAIGGEVFNPGIIDGEINFEPDFITVAYGTNDFSKSTREVMERDAAEFYRRLREAFPNAKIFAMMPIWRKDTKDKVRVLGTFEDAKAIVRAAAEAQPNTVVIDCDGFVPHHSDFFSDLRLHPNDIGFMRMADRISAVLEKLL
jgi:lysophospholipase L1-like esterase